MPRNVEVEVRIFRIKRRNIQLACAGKSLTDNPTDVDGWSKWVSDIVGAPGSRCRGEISVLNDSFFYYPSANRAIVNIASDFCQSTKLILLLVPPSAFAAR